MADGGGGVFDWLGSLFSGGGAGASGGGTSATTSLMGGGGSGGLTSMLSNLFGGNGLSPQAQQMLNQLPRNPTAATEAGMLNPSAAPATGLAGLFGGTGGAGGPGTGSGGNLSQQLQAAGKLMDMGQGDDGTGNGQSGAFPFGRPGMGAPAGQMQSRGQSPQELQQIIQQLMQYRQTLGQLGLQQGNFQPRAPGGLLGGGM